MVSVRVGLVETIVLAAAPPYLDWRDKDIIDTVLNGIPVRREVRCGTVAALKERPTLCNGTGNVIAFAAWTKGAGWRRAVQDWSLDCVDGFAELRRVSLAEKSSRVSASAGPIGAVVHQMWLRFRQDLPRRLRPWTRTSSSTPPTF